MSVPEAWASREHGSFDSREDVALAMAFARLPPERVEVITDAPAIASYAAWERRPPRRRRGFRHHPPGPRHASRSAPGPNRPNG